MGAPVLNSRYHQLGLTLVELLIAMAIVGVILAGIMALTGGVLRYTNTATSINELTTELNDVLGYIGLRLRSATQFVGATDSIVLTSGPSSFECSVASSSGPCLAGIMPVVNVNSPQSEITGYELRAYRVTTTSEWAADPGLPEGWNGPDTPILLEYRAAIPCPSPCSVPPSAPPSANASQVSYVVGGIVLEDSVGSSYDPFTSGNPLRATIRLRLQTESRSGLTSVPADGPLELRVFRRQ